MSIQKWVRGVEIEPSLYAADFANLGAQLEQLLDAGTRIFHFDVGDGHFVEPVTMGPIVLESIAPLIHERGVHSSPRHLSSMHIRGRLPEKVLVQVDGGIDETNASDVARAGAGLIVAGSAIFEEPDIARAYEDLCDDVDAKSSEPELKGT
jgi:pentose-5-phosphate-3-epimerase